MTQKERQFEKLRRVALAGLRTQSFGFVMKNWIDSRQNTGITRPLRSVLSRVFALHIFSFKNWVSVIFFDAMRRDRWTLACRGLRYVKGFFFKSYFWNGSAFYLPFSDLGRVRVRVRFIFCLMLCSVLWSVAFFCSINIVVFYVNGLCTQRFMLLFQLNHGHTRNIWITKSLKSLNENRLKIKSAAVLKVRFKDKPLKTRHIKHIFLFPKSTRSAC